MSADNLLLELGKVR